MVNRALEQYRQDILAVNARNAQAQQSINQIKLATDERIREAQTKAAMVTNNLASFSLTPGETKILPLTELGGQAGAQQFAGTQLPGGTQFSQAGQFGVFAAPAQKKGITIGGIEYDPATGQPIGG